MRTCVVCKRFSIPGDTSRSFHKFPDDCTLKDKWIAVLGLSSVTKSATVCSDHFEECAFHQTDGYTSLKRLLSDAVPIRQMNTQQDTNLTKESKNAQSSCTSSSEVCMSIPANDDLNETASVHISNDTAPTTPTFDLLEMPTRKSCFIIDDNNEVNIKRIRFMDGFKTKYFSRSDCVSNEAWNRFVQYKNFKDKQQDKVRKKNYRMSKKLKIMNEVVEGLKEQENLTAAEYFKVF